MTNCEICRNHKECKLEEKDKVSRCGFVYPTELELAKKTKEYALGYEQGRADVLKDITKIIDDYACDRDIKSNVSLGQMISQYIYKQTKEQNNDT